MTVQIHMTNAEARRVSKKLRKVDDKDFTEIADAIDAQLAEQAPSAPLRKVIGKRHSFNFDVLYLDLECGHTKTYRGDATIHDAKGLKRVRCKRCTA